MTLNHNYGYFSSVSSGIAGNVLVLQAVAEKYTKIIGVCPNNASTKKLLTKA